MRKTSPIFNSEAGNKVITIRQALIDPTDSSAIFNRTLGFDKPVAS
jgi:hypothetical protein